jgi:cytoskeleton protein RodZ
MMEHQNNAEQVNRSTATPPASLGSLLREARESLGYSVADVAAQIKFAPRQIEALEADDFKSLPEAAFVRGFVRSYAKILHLDMQSLLAMLPQAKETAAELIPASVDMPFPGGNTSQRQTLILLGAALMLAVIAVGFAVWHFTTPIRQSTVAKLETPVSLPAEKQVIPEPLVQKQNMATTPNTVEPKRQSSVTVAQSSVRAAKTKAAASAGQPSATVAQSSVQATKTKAKAKAVAAAGPSSATVAQSSVRAANTRAVQAESQTEMTGSENMDDASTPTAMLRLVFDEESWTEITDKDGKIISSRVNPRGSELNVQGHLPLSLVIGHAATAHLYKDGAPVDLTRYINSSSEVARITLK